MKARSQCNRRTFLRWGIHVSLLLPFGQAIASETAVAFLRIDGMTGGTGPIVVRKALEGLKGVTSAEVSFKEKLARVTYEREVVTIEQMVEAVKRAGFLATPQ